MNAVKEDIEKLVNKELAAANEKFPHFASNHEGYAVLKEEIEEAHEQLIYAEISLNNLWENVKENKTAQTLNHAAGIKILAINLAAEAVQVAAMAQKFIDSAEKREETHE